MKLSVNTLCSEHQFRHRHPVNALNLRSCPVISQFRARRLRCFPERNRLSTHRPPNRHQFLLNNFPACYQRFASRSVGFSLRLTTSHSKLNPPILLGPPSVCLYAPTSCLPDRPPPPFEKFLSKCYKSTFCCGPALAYTGCPAMPQRGSGQGFRKRFKTFRVPSHQGSPSLTGKASRADIILAKFTQNRR